MEKTNNIEFESLLQNEEFIRLMNESPLQAIRAIEDLCRENPDKEETIRLAAQLVHHYHTAEMYDVDNEKITIMWNNILQKSQTRKPIRTFRMASIWKIAASVAILLSFTFYFFEYTGNSSIRQFAGEQVKISNEARIIISDGSEHILKSNDSHIRYDSDGKGIAIEDKNDKTEKLTNQPKETKAVFNQIVVPYGSRHSATLSDGTVVQLNSGSVLVFPAKFSDSKREVYLKGEGYFDVMKDAEKPFIVNTDYINVKVLGTHFNISAYENENSASAVLVEGSVEVSKNSVFKKERCEIIPGQGCFFTDKSTKLKIQNVDVEEFTSWKDGILQFRDQPLASIIKRVEKFYNKNITIENNELANRIISGKLVLSSKFDETIEFLARTTKSRYILKDDGIYIFMN